MSKPTSVFGAAVVGFLLNAASANAEWIGGYRTWPGLDPGAQLSDHNTTCYAPFISDYGSYWGQDNNDTNTNYFVRVSGTVVVDSCWQSWTGSAVDCQNPTSTSSQGQQELFVNGFGAVSNAEDPWDYFYIEYVPYNGATVEVGAVEWQL